LIDRRSSFEFRISSFNSGATTVNQRLLAEFTALVAAEASLVIEGPTPISNGLLWVYWQHSQGLWRRWRKTIEDTANHADPVAGRLLLAAAKDVLVSEMLTRVWGAVLTACDLRRGTRHAEPIARSVLAAHGQCRVSVLRLLVHSQVLPIERLAELDRTRRRVERWTDVLVGPLVARFGEELADFAFDQRRAHDFGSQQSPARFQATSQPAWSFLMAGLRSAFPGEAGMAVSTKDPTLPIMRSVLAAFPDDAFGSEGPIKSLRWARISRSGQNPECAAPLLPRRAGNFRQDIAGHARHDPHRSAHRPQQ
jgi:hypothetical protein